MKRGRERETRRYDRKKEEMERERVGNAELVYILGEIERRIEVRSNKCKKEKKKGENSMYDRSCWWV